MTRISRHAAAVAAGAAVVGIAVGAGVAHAEPFAAQGTRWCPGEALPFDNIQWDMNVCHTWYTVPFGQGNVRMVDLKGNSLDSFIYAGDTPPVLTPVAPAPSGPPPGTPFCSPRGALIIIPPICDEIGVDWPPGSLQN